MFNTAKRTLYGDWDTKPNKFSLVRATSSLGKALLSAEETSLEVIQAAHHQALHPGVPI